MGKLVYSVQECLLERQGTKGNLYNVLGRALAKLVVTERTQVFFDDDMVDTIEEEYEQE